VRHLPDNPVSRIGSSSALPQMPFMIPPGITPT